jgi:ATP-dependent DNA helicase RecQ
MDLDNALREHFGFAAFRPGQRDACEAALAGRDALVVMPTGSGKSLCYQLPALMRDDVTIVVSPLVSLMQDQVEGLAARAPGRAALVNAQQDPAANRDAVARAANGELRLLYVAPERFASPGFADALAQARVGLFVVDEAHCVSQWGHDFRPDYFRLADAARYVGAGALFASTATATPQVAKDIAGRLALRDPVHVTTGAGPRLTSAGASRRRWRRRTRCPRSSTRARARAPSRWRATCPARSGSRRWPTTRACRGISAPRCSGASWAARRRS